MGSSQLRRRLLLAMGLPMIGCGGAQREERPPPELVGNEKQPREPGEPCTIDELPESICGAVSGSDATSCGPTGDALTSYGESSIWVTQGGYGSHDATWAAFDLDPAATERYQASIQASQPNLPIAEYCCYSSCTPLRVAKSAQLDVPAGFHVESTCIPPPPAGTNVPAATASECPAAVFLGGELRPHDGNGSFGQCCYQTVVQDYEEHHYRGRPARIDGVARVAPSAPVAGWTAPVVIASPGFAGARSTASAVRSTIASLPAEVRARLAAAWTETAQMEHASIAAFSHLALRLIAAGAPPELLIATHRAALDEIEHARIAFALATAYADAPVGPAPFPAVADLRPDADLAALAIETFVDGCIGETVAACEAQLASARCTDPTLAATLARIAEDETRHAELAWAIVAWCVRREPALRETLTRALADGRTPAPPDAASDDLSAHGVLPARELAAIRREVIATVVSPCLQALVSA